MHSFPVALALALPPSTPVDHRGDRYHVVTLDLREQSLSQVGQADGIHTFEDLPPDVVATNSGIFHAPDEPVGLWIEDGAVHHPLEVRDGEGNFFLKPNGVFWIDASGAHVDDAQGFVAPRTTRLATQSGPLLLLDGVVHPAFQVDSSSRKLRSAVGVSDPWTVHLVVSAGPVRFHDLATLFRDVLHAPDALYLDGTISGLAADGAPSPPDKAYAGFLIARDRPAGPALAEGDVVFQRSRSAQSDAIRDATGSPWTHVGIVRMIEGRPYVLEASATVRLTPWPTWQASGVNGEVLVRRWAEPWTPEAVARLDALQARWLGRPYDLRFQPGDEQLYCSELVREAFLGALDVELAPLRPVSSYAVADPALRARMTRRWGAVPESLEVVAPSDLLEAGGWSSTP